MDAQKDIILPNALDALQQSATGLPIFTLSVHSQQYLKSGKKSREGLVYQALPTKERESLVHL